VKGAELGILLFLNELSCGTPQSPQQVNQAMEQFVDLLRYVRKQREQASLVLPVKREDLELAQGYYVNQWINAGRRNLDLWRYIKTMRSQAPISSAVPPGVAEVFDYFCNDHRAEGARAAHLMDGLLVSFLVDPMWDVPHIEAVCEELIETSAGDLDTQQYPVTIRHAARLEHAEVHESWIKQAGVTAFRSGAEIWEARADLYPHLQFLSQVQGNLYDLRVDWVIPVSRRLRTLDDAVAQWESTGSEPHDWGSKVTSESERRRRFCYFTDEDGERRLFELHARFTPGVGRIHLRLVPEARKARIAYIGLKIRPDI
jgi:hypothetical protein